MPLTTELFINLLTALALGALIGTEREIKKANEDPQRASFAGIRTYTLASLIGFAGAWASQQYSIAIAAILLVGVSAFFMGGYLSGVKKSGLLGITSELSGVLAFLVGMIAFSQPFEAGLIGIATTLLLALKHPLHRFVHSLTPAEFLSAVKFIIVAFVVLPVLPRTAVDPWGIFVPFNIWLMVVFVSAVSFVGYILVRSLGPQKGIGLTGLVGGLASSTATTMSLAQQGKGNKKLAWAITFGVVASSTVMFGRAMLEVAVVNPSLLPSLSLDLGVMIAASVVAMGFLAYAMRKEKTAKTEAISLSSPFRLAPAIQFALFYMLILALAEIAHRYFGEGGVYIASLVSGLADVDAITLTLSNLAEQQKITPALATHGITLAIMTNTLVKVALVGIFGNALLLRRSALALGFVVLCGGGAILFGG